MLKVVPRPALNNSQRLAFPKTSPGASTALHCISPGCDYPTSFCPRGVKFPSLTARPCLKHLWGFTSLLGQARDLGEVLSLLINPCLLLWPFFAHFCIFMLSAFLMMLCIWRRRCHHQASPTGTHSPPLFPGNAPAEHLQWMWMSRVYGSSSSSFRHNRLCSSLCHVA